MSLLFVSLFFMHPMPLRAQGVLDGSTEFKAVSWNCSVYVAVGMRGALVNSPDGITWTQRDAGVGTLRAIQDVAWNGSLFAAIVDNDFNGLSDSMAVSIATTTPLGKLGPGETESFSIRVTGYAMQYVLPLPVLDANTE